VGKPLVPRPFGIAVRKGDTEFINWVNAELRKIRSDGTYDRLWENYFAEFEANLVRP
jgi:ABC-type amino acid transport substrate-binding protein